MVTEPFVPFHEEYLHGVDNSLLWALSPELPFDCTAAFPELMQEIDPPVAPPPPAHWSAFGRYARSEGAQMSECCSSETRSGGDGGRNIHRRVIEMLRSIPKGEEPSGVETSRGFRHMMRERQRREKLSQSYADLYSMIASRSKGDKNSIIQSAAQYVRELQGVQKALQKRNEELKAEILRNNATDGAKIKISVTNPSSSIDSMIAALRCLKSLDVKAKAIRSDLSSTEFSATMSIDTKMATADVERVVQGALMEVEKKLHRQLPGINTRSQQCHVENMI
ncbi:transcription factor BHLH148 [Musa acuminata AAA Group]|uniref:transcription factor BHLH148 n=1 Tax=Musa acuminata AAA Group TaxID=214697 RepID=UPI0031DC0AC7